MIAAKDQKPRGRFITLEGGEGVGKSTQMRALAAALSAHVPVMTTREPGGSAGGEQIRALLLDPKAGWNIQTEALLFAANRSDHLDHLIRPALAAGTWVLCDRYVDSSRAYQSWGGPDGTRALSDDAIMALHQFGSGGMMPDRTLMLTLPHDLAAQRRRARDGVDGGDRYEQREADFHAHVATVFARIAANEPTRVRVIDAQGAAEHVTARAMAALSDLLP